MVVRRVEPTEQLRKQLHMEQFLFEELVLLEVAHQYLRYRVAMFRYSLIRFAREFLEWPSIQDFAVTSTE